MGKAQGLDHLFNPSSIAIIGASKDERIGGGYLLKGLIENKFRGKLYPVNPKQTEIMGLRSYPSILDIPGEVDLAILAIPARIVPQVIGECSQKGVKFAVVHSAGFSELGSQGKELENAVLQIAQQGDIRVVGPNCMGLYCPQVGLNTIVPTSILEDEAGSGAFLCQSGWVSENCILSGYERGLRFSKVVSVGNQADLTIEDFLEYLAGDEETKVIGCYIEGVKRGKGFFQLVKQISKKKPIIVWKTGRSEVGIEAAASHTGSLAGNGIVFDAALRQCGIVIAQNFEELMDLAVGFACPVLPRGNRLGLLVEAGGGAVAGADICEVVGLEMPALPMATQKELADTVQSAIPIFPNRRNPVDILWVPPELSVQVYIQCARIILQEVNAIVIVGYAPLDENYTKQLVDLRDEMAKPIIVVPGHPTEEEEGMSRLVRNGIPAFTIPERAIKVLAAMVRYANYVNHSSE